MSVSAVLRTCFLMQQQGSVVRAEFGRRIQQQPTKRQPDRDPTCTLIDSSIYTSMHFSMPTSMFRYTTAHAYVVLYIFHLDVTDICRHLCDCASIYIYVHTYVHVHAYTHIHVNTHTF